MEDKRVRNQQFFFKKALQPLPNWFKYAVIALVILGIFFRFYNLESKVYWIDETYTSLRMSGYTKAEFVQNVFTGEVVGVETLQRYQHLNPEKGLIDTLRGIAVEESQLTPLYFVLTKFWIKYFGDSITGIRSFSAVIGLFAFPCLWWLCRELFETSLTAWMALALFAVTPLHILYAQEARPYCLWTVIALLSSAVLLWAMRTNTRRSWGTYGLTVALGLYTHLLFSAVAIAHGIYVTVTEKVIQQRQLSQTFLSYILAAGTGFLAFIPWLILFVNNFNRFDNTSAFGRDSESFSYLMNKWFENLNKVFIGEQIGAANYILVFLTVYGLYLLYRYTPQRIWLFVMTLIGVPFLVLAFPDVVLEGGRAGRSLRIRYLIPSYLGIQIALAYLFATQAIWVKNWVQKLWRMVLIIFITGSIIACAVISQSPFWWSKGGSRCAYYFPVSDLINQTDKPLIISDGGPSDILGLSNRLNPNVKFQLVTDPKQLKIAPEFNSIFLINSSQQMRNILTQQGYKVTLVYAQNEKEKDKKRLWRVNLPARK